MMSEFFQNSRKSSCHMGLHMSCHIVVIWLSYGCHMDLMPGWLPGCVPGLSAGDSSSPGDGSSAGDSSSTGDGPNAGEQQTQPEQDAR